MKRLEELGQAEVDDLDMAVLGDDQVCGFDVTVDDAFVVSAGETFGRLAQELERSIDGKGTAREHFAQFLAADELHRHERHPVGFVDLVDDGDVRNG
jgi:hypothetical protein